MVGTSINITAHGCACRFPILRIDHKLYGAPDILGSTSHFGTMPIEHFIFVLEIFGCTSCVVPDRCILSHYAQRELLTTATNHKGWIGFLNGFWLTIGLF